ncbi:MAG: FliH/SctL family protein [Algisphaera sp.]
MPILKQMQARPLIKDAVVLDLGDLAAQGRRLLDAARERADEILAAARVEAQTLTDTAAAEGRAQGHAQGLVAGQEEGRVAGHAQAVADVQADATPLLKSLAGVAEHWNTQCLVFEESARVQVLKLAVAMGRKVVHRHVAVDVSVVTDQVAAVLRKVLEPTDLRLRVHPEDRPVLAQTLPDLLAGMVHLKHVDWVDDPSVGRGGCAVDLTGGAGIDASVDLQLDRIAQRLLPVAEEEDQNTGQDLDPASELDSDPNSDVDPAPTSDPAL